MTLREALMWLLIAVLVALPARYDPAIRLKKWLMNRGVQRTRSVAPAPPLSNDEQEEHGKRDPHDHQR